MQSRSVIFSYLFILLFIFINDSIAQHTDGFNVHVGVQQFDTSFNRQLTGMTKMRISQGDFALHSGAAHWKVSYRQNPVLESPEAFEHQFRFYCTEGNSKNSNIFVTITIDDWSDRNYVLLPAAAYNGNRFPSRRLRYSPKLHDIKDIDPDKGMIISDVPRLGLPGYPSLIQERSGSMSTPSAGYFSETRKQYFWMLTDQGNEWGDHGITLRESADRRKFELSISSPVVRERTAYTICDNQQASWDLPANYHKGDSIVIRFRTYSGPARHLQTLFDRFFDIRSDLSVTKPLIRQLPLSECMHILENKFNAQNFVEPHGYYAVGMRENFLQDWQIGWTGGMISTYPLLANGTPATKERVIRNFNWLFPNGISPSGFFWDAGRNGTEWLGGDIRNSHTRNWHLIRKSGDALWYILKQFEWMGQQNIKIDKRWSEGVKKVSDAFVRLWKENRQIGQFIDAQTGDIIVGGSSSGAIVPAALVLAKRYFDDMTYATTAIEIGQYFYQNFTSKGITCGGPGDALQNPDSESSAAILESYIALYELTKDSIWLIRSGEAARQFATWVVSYDYNYNDTTAFGKAGIRTKGSVYANTQNKHAAPGICTASGQGLFKLYLYSGDVRYLHLLEEITRGISQYVPHPKAPLGSAPVGWVSERINLTDWEGAGTIGYILPISTWAETTIMLSYTELPAVYIKMSDRSTATFDVIDACFVSQHGKKQIYKLRNPTEYPSDIQVMWTEVSGQHNKQMRLHLLPGQEKLIPID